MHEPINILVVDDQPGKVTTYRVMLEELGENILVAHSVRDALEILLRTDVAVILADVVMPDLDGFALVELIRQHPRFEKTAVMFVSAAELDEADRIRGYSAGAVDFLMVPVVPEILRARVRVFAELYRKTRALERLNRELEERVAARTADLEAEARRKDEFLATLAHELRNPLAPIRTAVQLLRRPDADRAAFERCLAVLDRQTVHLTRLVDDLLDVARISRGSITLRTATLDLGRLVRAAVESSGLASGVHQLEVDTPPEGPIVNGDAVRLTQIVGNLLDNATKFTPAGGRIRVSVDTNGDAAVIHVADEGIGMPPEALEKVFGLFAQLEPHGTRRGLGIGLALVRRLVELHGGEVTAHSEGPGQGTTFRVRLPIVTPDPAPTIDATPHGPSFATRILVVDDNTDAATLLAELLAAHGHETRVAHDGATALAIGPELCPDVVLLDLGMPGLDGYETARLMRGTPWGSAARIVAVTGWGQASDRERTAEAGFDVHLVKPVDVAQVLALLESR